MKEKIGKLLELLNEYSKNIGYFNEEDLQGQTKAWILSKEFGWLKWLVENDKIRDLDKLEYVYGIEMVRHGTEELYTAYSLYENLLMLLSISDTPIEDLVSYLR